MSILPEDAQSPNVSIARNMVMLRKPAEILLLVSIAQGHIRAENAFKLPNNVINMRCAVKWVMKHGRSLAK